MTISDHDPRVLATLLLALHDRLKTICAPRWQRENVSGFARVGWIECPKCRGTGETTWKHRTVKCDRPHCHGAGGWYGDPMMAAKISRPVDTDQHHDSSVLAFGRRIGDMELAELDRLDTAIDQATGIVPCEECEGSGRRTATLRCACCHGTGHKPDLAADLEETARTTARHEHPSTLQLWDALSIMLRDFPHHGGILYRVYVWAWTPEQHLDGHDRELADDALHILAETLCARSPGFRAPTWALRAVEAEKRGQTLHRNGRWANPAHRQERDQEIRRKHAEGTPTGKLAKRFGLDRKQVQRILNSEREAA